MTQEDLNEFLDAYIITMQLTGFDYYYEISEAIKTDVYCIKDKSNRYNSVMEFFYHKKEQKGFIFIIKFKTDDINVAARTKTWMDKYAIGNNNEIKSYYGHEASFGVRSVESFIDFFTNCILKDGRPLYEIS